MQISKLQNFLISPWRNGGGVTRQIAICSESATVAELDFDWRLSWATIEKPGEFSLFPDYERLLVIWEGEEISLNHHSLQPLIPFHFSGELKINCQLHSKPVQDLGLIYRPEKIDAVMKVHYVKGRQVLPLAQVTLLFCVSGEANVAGHELQRAQCLYIKNGSELVIVSPQAVLIEVGLNFK